MWMLLTTLALGAEAPKEPTDVNHFWYRGYGAVAFLPTGLLFDTAFEFRAPVLRLGGLAFNTTYIGAGMRTGISPAHMEIAGRFSFQLIDLLPVTVEGFWTNYWDSPWAPVPVDHVKGQLGKQRRPLYDAGRDFKAQAFGVNISPTFQVQYKNLVAFSSWTFTFMTIGPPQSPEPWVYEPVRGLIVAPNDRIIDHTSALMWQFKDGKDHTSILRVGPVVRGKMVKNTPDETLQAGAMAMWRPGRVNTAPTITAIVTPYLKDPDFAVGLPYIALVISASKAVPLQKLRSL